MGRDILQKLGISLQQRPKQTPGNHINSILHIETLKNIIKWVLKIYTPLYANRQIKNHFANSVFKQNHTPNQQKRRSVPLNLLEKVELELDKLIQDEQSLNSRNARTIYS